MLCLWAARHVRHVRCAVSQRGVGLMPSGGGFQWRELAWSTPHKCLFVCTVIAGPWSGHMHRCRSMAGVRAIYTHVSTDGVDEQSLDAAPTYVRVKELVLSAAQRPGSRRSDGDAVGVPVQTAGPSGGQRIDISYHAITHGAYRDTGNVADTGGLVYGESRRGAHAAMLSVPTGGGMDTSILNPAC